jgi:asparagine synthase (glutamine-hydrolysing)
MSDIFITSNLDLDLDSVADFLKFTPFTKTIPIETGRIRGFVNRLDDPAMWGPASDVESGVTVCLSGRIALDEVTWNKAEKLPFKGGLACRWILERYLDKSESLAVRLNGAFAVVILDQRRKVIEIITDRMGHIPVYRGEGPDLVMATQPDAVAMALSAAGMNTSLDRTSVAQMILHGGVTQPHTFYQQVQQLEPATHFIMGMNGSPNPPGNRVYWSPRFLEDVPAKPWPEIEEEVANVINKAIRMRTHDRLGKTGLFLSGGVDSRTVLFGACAPSKIECMTFFDEPNRELEVAAELAALASATHHPLQREFEHYAMSAEISVKICGGMGSFKESHIPGFQDQVRKLGVDNVLTGDFADALFEGWTLGRKKLKILGVKTNISMPTGYRHPFASFKEPDISDFYYEEIMARCRALFPECEVGVPVPEPLSVELRKLRPLNRSPGGGGRSAAFRTVPLDVVFLDKDILDLYGRFPANAKMNGTTYERGVSRILGPEASAIFNNNNRLPVGSGLGLRIVNDRFKKTVRRLKRKIGRGVTKTGIATCGSWPNFKNYIWGSEKIRELWADPAPEEREFFTTILGTDPWLEPMANWALKDNDFLRILTVRIWLKQQKMV